ncbi:hypothetical protein [Pseudomonas kairouanensis]|nr:hypothetical protein [Pseudomonas kairouanensis]
MTRSAYQATATAFALVLTLTACGSIVKSSSKSPGSSGVAYMLPKALLPVELTERSGAFTLSVKEPLVTGDPTKQFVLERSANPFSSDNVQVTVGANTGLLQAVKVESTDQSLSTIVKLVSAIRAEAADTGAAPNLVYRGLLDPSEGVKTLNVDLNRAAIGYLRTRQALSCSTPDSTECTAVRQLAQVVNGRAFGVELNAASATPASTSGEAVNCNVGLCYRQNLPYILKLTGPNGESNTALALLPNSSPTYVLPVERWAFVKSTHDIKLQDGVLQSVTTDRPSSALAVASAPVDAAKAVFGAVGEVLQLKIDLSGKETALANAKIAEINAKSDLDKALLAKNGAKAEAVLFGSGTNSSALATLTVGSPQASDALGGLHTESPPVQNAPPAGMRQTQSNDGDIGTDVSGGH